MSWQFKWRNTAKNVSLFWECSFTLLLNSSLSQVHNYTCSVFISGWSPTLNYTWTKTNIWWLRCKKMSHQVPTLLSRIFIYAFCFWRSLGSHTAFALIPVLLERTRVFLWGSETGGWPEHRNADGADLTSRRDQCKIYIFIYRCACLCVYEFLISVPHQSLPGWTVSLKQIGKLKSA